MVMQIDIITIFPDMFQGPLDASIVRRARESGVAEIAVHDLRDSTHDRHRSVDDAPYGGGAGMVMRPEPWFEAVEGLRASGPVGRVVLLTPQGRQLTQAVAEELAREERLILLCGRYEGVDERVREHLIDREISIGDYVLSGGEIPAMVVVDSLVRLIPGAVGDTESLEDDSHSSGLIQFPQYTRPSEYRGWPVPPVLLSGNHQEVHLWRRQQSLRRTQRQRPDLLAGAPLSPQERLFLEHSEE